MKRIAYISSPHFADCDIPLLSHIQQNVDLIYILRLNNDNKQLTLCNVPCIKNKGGVFRASEYEGLGKIEKYIRKENLFVLNMPGKKDLSPSNLLAIARLLLFLIRQKTDVIHLTWPLRYGEFMLYLLHRRMILTLHDPFSHSSEDHWHNRLHRWMAFHLISRFILLNRSQKDAFIDHYHMQKKQVYISELSIYTHLQDTIPIRPQESGYILFFGGINTHKGLEYLCQAMGYVHKTHPEAHLIIAGKGKIYFDIEPYIQMGVVRLLNHYLSDEELAGLISEAAFIVCPYTDATQSGVVMSAFALAKPVVATAVGGLPEMVIDNRYGLIVPPRNAEGLASAISKLLDSPSTLKQMSSCIQEDYHSGKHSWETISQDIIRIYNQEFS